VDVIVIEFADILRVVRPLKCSNSVLLPVFVIAFIPGIIWPRLDAVAMLPVFFPVTRVFGAIHVLIGATSLRFIIVPFSLVDIAVRMNKATFSVSLIILPIAAVLAAIFPDLYTLAFSFTFFAPLAMINGAVI
jgi:hypothetical protein